MVKEEMVEEEDVEEVVVVTVEKVVRSLREMTTS